MLQTKQIWDLISLKLSEHELIKVLNEMSGQFTLYRDQIKNYTLSEQGVSAYSYFYLPTNLPKFNFLMSQLNPEDCDAIKKGTLVDFGCGPGTYTLGYLDYFQVENAQITLVDSSEFMLRQARQLIDHLFPKAQVTYQNTINSVSKPGTLLFGHSLNEIGFLKGSEIIKELNPNYVIIIEPGTQEVFSYINDLRKLMRKNGYACLYPCPSLEGDCPMLERSGDWCHGIINMVHDPELERLSQLIRKDRRRMPHISHVYGKVSPQKRPNHTRTVRLLNESKFGFDLEVCKSEFDRIFIEKIQMMKKDLSKSQIKYLQNMNIGIRIEYIIIKEYDDFKRVKLINIDSLSNEDIK